jgi:hypothetical protein
MSQMTPNFEPRGIDTLMKSLDALQPTGERTTAAKFAALYANIEQALIRGVTQRAVVEALERDGLKLHPAKFKKLLEEARAQHNENGDGIRCQACGGIQPTPSAPEAQLEEGGEK